MPYQRLWASAGIAAVLALGACSRPADNAHTTPTSPRAAAEISCVAPKIANPPLAVARSEEQRYLDLQQRMLGKPEVSLEQAFPKEFDKAYESLAPGAVAWMANELCEQAKLGALGATDLLRASLLPENIVGTSISAAAGFCVVLTSGGQVSTDSQKEQARHTCPQLLKEPAAVDGGNR